MVKDKIDQKEIPKIKRIEKRVMEIFDPPVGKDSVSRYTSIFISLLVLINILAVILESVPAIGDEYKIFFNNFEFYCIIIFTFEYILRAWSSGSRYKEEKGGAWRGRKEYKK